jgi:hypothetical protein
MKLLVLILATKKQPWERILREGIYKTWASKEYDNVKIVSYYGDVKEKREDGSGLYLPTPCIQYTHKTLLAFKHSLENYDFDFILRTNVSTYVRVKRFYEWLKDKPLEKFYSGFPHNHKKFGVSGTCMVYSKDLIKMIVDNMNKIKRNPDDVALSKFLNDMNVPRVKNIDRLDLEKQEVPDKKILEKYMFIRCKTKYNNGKLSEKDMKRNDDEKMITIHKKLYT